MRVGILGSGLMGGKLGTLFAHAGHEVVFSYARSKDKEKLNRLAREARGNARYTEPRYPSPTSRMEEQKAQNWHTASRDPFARSSTSGGHKAEAFVPEP
jgi:predicted dinucleotide-binding enzyme